MGSIEQLDRNTGTKWRAVPWLAGDGGGRGRKGPTRTFGSFREAEAYIAGVEKTDDDVFEAAGVPVRRNEKRVTFAAYALLWADGAAEWATRRTYRSHALTLGRAWPDAAIDEVDGQMIRRHLAEMQDAGRAATTRNCRLAVLRGIFTQARRDGLVTGDPVDGVRSPRLSRKPRVREITEPEMLAVMAELPEWFAPAVFLGYDSGLRAGEVCGLRWSHIDLERAEVTVGPVTQANGGAKGYPKNGEIETIPLSERAVAELAAYRVRHAGGRADLVFREPRAVGRIPIHPDRIKNLWKAARAKAGLEAPLPRWHDLRHGTAKRALRAGVPPHVVQRLMRHASITSTQVYFPSVTEAELRAAVAAGQPPRLAVVRETA